MNLDEMARVASSTDAASFRVRFPHPVLVMLKLGRSGQTGSGTARASTDEIRLAAKESGTSGLQSPDKPHSEVFVVAKSRRNAWAGITVGRSPDNDVFLPLPTVSKVHAVLEPAGPAVFRVTDPGSTNGTFVDGKRIAKGGTLLVADGARLAFGPDAVARFLLPDAFYGFLVLHAVAEDT